LAGFAASGKQSVSVISLAVSLFRISVVMPDESSKSLLEEIRVFFSSTRSQWLEVKPAARREYTDVVHFLYVATCERYAGGQRPAI